MPAVIQVSGLRYGAVIVSESKCQDSSIAIEKKIGTEGDAVPSISVVNLCRVCDAVPSFSLVEYFKFVKYLR